MNVIARWTTPIALAGLIAGCSDPTADVTAAKVGEAQPVAEAAPAQIETGFETEAAPAPEAEGAAEPGLAGTASAPAASPATGQEVAFDGEASKVGFAGSKLVGGGHDGGFKTFAGRFVLSPEGDEVASVSATIDMNSLWSDNDKLTEHLKNADFFEVSAHPESEFVSTAIAPASAGAEGATHEITGNLTMHGVTKSITFPATVAVTDAAVTLDAEFKIDRTTWGIVYGAESDVRDRIINKDVVIRLDLDAPRQPASLTSAEATE